MNSDSQSGQYSIIRFNLLTSLLAVLNKNDETDTDFVIAKYILVHLDSIRDTSIYQVAEDCYVSRSSVQRFVKEIGYDSFSQMKTSLKDVFNHEGALLDYTDHTDYTSYVIQSVEAMNRDIARTASGKDFRKLIELFVNARSVVILSAEDSVHACKLLQQQLLAIGKLVRIITSTSKNISLLDALEKDDLLMVCSVSGNFALAIDDQLKQISASKCLITLNRTTVFLGNYEFIYYISEEFKPSSRKIHMFRNVYTTYGLTFLFDLFYHECYLYYQSKDAEITE